MTRYKTHLIAVKKLNDKENMIMRDIRDAMEYLAIMMTQQHSYQNPKVGPPRRQSPATHIYCYDAKVTPLPHN